MTANRQRISQGGGGDDWVVIEGPQRRSPTHCTTMSLGGGLSLGLKESGVDFVAADMPNANRLTVGIMAMVAEDEAQRIFQRTKDALAAAKRRGVKLGGDRGVIPNARSHKASAEALHARTAARAADLEAGKTSLRAIAEGLNAQGIPTSRGNGEWTATQVMRVLERLDPFVAEVGGSDSLAA